jgi:hypothetical protein
MRYFTLSKTSVCLSAQTASIFTFFLAETNFLLGPLGRVQGPIRSVLVVSYQRATMGSIIL